MTNEELKKKICDIIAPYVSAYGDDERIADALIAAGIGDLKEHRVFAGKDGSIKQLYSGEEVEQIVKERDEYKHRAEVAEKAGRIIQRDMARVFDVSNQRIGELIANIWDLAKKQAEKELAEERKDE